MLPCVRSGCGVTFSKIDVLDCAAVISDDDVVFLRRRIQHHFLHNVIEREDKIDRFILEEMAKLIAANPRSMSDDSDDEQNGGDETAVSSLGFQGADWAAAMSKSLTKDSAADIADARNRSGEAMRTYDMLNAVAPSVPGAPSLPIRRNDPS